MTVQAQDIFELNERLGRAVNFGNALEAPSEGAWGMTLEPSFFDLVKEAGFATVRLPVSWTHHVAKEAPYDIDAEFVNRVQWAVAEATTRGLNIIVNVHHYDELNKDPLAEEERYLAIWQQIAEHFKGHPTTVYFELLNEPHDTFSGNAELWNTLLVKVLNVVRKTNPDRAVIVGPNNWNSISSLSQLTMPDDPNIIVTVHFYEPFEFTHQGAEWVNPSPPLGVSWIGDDHHVSAIRGRLELATTWAKENKRPIFVGEFGAYDKADYDSRVRWTRFVRSEFEKRGFSWAYWEFGSRFGIYDRKVKAWREELRDALLTD
jgi:endoglucanase